MPKVFKSKVMSLKKGQKLGSSKLSSQPVPIVNSVRQAVVTAYGGHMQFVPLGIRDTYRKANSRDISYAEQWFYRLLYPGEFKETEAIGVRGGAFRSRTPGYDMVLRHDMHDIKIEVKAIGDDGVVKYWLSDIQRAKCEVIAILNINDKPYFVAHKLDRYECAPGGYTLIRN